MNSQLHLKDPHQVSLNRNMKEFVYSVIKNLRKSVSLNFHRIPIQTEEEDIEDVEVILMNFWQCF